MSKIELGSMQIFPEPFSLPKLVEQCCDMIQIKADQGQVTLARECRGDLEEVVADKRACKQILLNLLSNAVKFTPPRGTVTVRLRPEGNSLVLAVSDTGIGIGADDLARLGDPFFQASSSHDRSYEGTGLGLSVVRGLVGLHGGVHRRRERVEDGHDGHGALAARRPKLRSRRDDDKDRNHRAPPRRGSRRGHRARPR